MSIFSRGNVNEESGRGEGREGMGGWVRGWKEILTKRLEENRDRKQKSQPSTRSKSGRKYTACSLDSVFLQKEKEDGHVMELFCT